LITVSNPYKTLKMPFPFVLPTTNYVDLSPCFSSSTHPSLIQATTSERAQLRHVLKSHKRLEPAVQASNLRAVLDAVDRYLPYISSLETALSGKDVGGEHVDVTLVKEPEFEWRPMLSLRKTASLSSSMSKGRWKQKGLDAELLFVWQIKAAVLSLLAKEELRPLLRTDVAPPEPEERKQYVVAAMKMLLQAHGIHKRQLELASAVEFDTRTAAPEILPQVQYGLASLAMAEATLAAVLKDDPFPVAMAEQTNAHSREWMYRTSSVDVNRTKMLGRICIAAAEHASKAAGSLKNIKDLDDDMKQYSENLYMVCRAKAARFSGIAAEAEGQTGQGIAWIQAAKKELGIKEKSMPKVLQNWKDKKEAERIEQGKMSWGMDAGKSEESRVLDMIERKWKKVNDTVSSLPS
jgi:hypothetical protein